jgi:UDP-N-acetylmuramyl pentapeptide phosphotransferase/UDP-N-acetylglucosamine-1-phosphate transferase
VCVLLVSRFGVGVIRVIAPRFNLVDTPNSRSSHANPVPLGGGIALVAINLAAWIAFTALHDGVTLRHAMVLITGAMLVASISLIDDLGRVPYPIRLFVQAVAALIFILGYVSFQVVSFPAIGAFSLGLLRPVLSVIWIVGLINAYNFMDGIDGMVGGQTVAAGLGWVILGLLRGHMLLVLLGAFLAASSLGFLGHNWYPVRIFMGDVGATFLGYTFAVITVVAAHYDPKLALAGILLVWPSIFDTGFTVIRRLQRRETIFTGHKTFLFHHLVSAGWSHQAAALLYVPLPILGAVMACTWARGSRPMHEGVAVLLVAACLTLWTVVRREERLVSSMDVLVAESLLEGVRLARTESERIARGA